MANVRPGPIAEWLRIEVTPEGYWLRAMPGAQAFPLPEVIAWLLAVNISGVDYRVVKEAWDAADGARRPISTSRPGASASEPSPMLTPTPPERKTPVAVPAAAAGVQVEEAGGELYLTLAPSSGEVSLRDLLTHLTSRFGASRLDLSLVRLALHAPRGTRNKVSRKAPAEPPQRARKLQVARPLEGVLLACAEDHLRDRLTETLERRGIVVHPAPSATVALNETLARMPDVLLVTHPLGNEDGIAFIKQVRAHARVQRTPVVVIPANPSREVVREAVEAGANDLLVRPVTPGALIRKVGKALESIGKAMPPETSTPTEAEVPAVAAEEELKSAGKVDLVKLANRVDKLLALPAVVQRVMSITADPRTGARELGVAIGSDPAVGATVLKKANSAYFGKKERISDIQEALVRLGFIQTRSLVVGMSMIHLFARGQRSVGFHRGEFWRHCMATAIIAKLLADRAAYPSPDLAFIAGLLHDVGKILLDEYYSAEYEQAALVALKDLVPMRVAERRVLDTDHPEVGGAILELWKFPPPIATAVSLHHDRDAMTREADPQQQKLCRIVHVANLLAKATGEGNGGDQIVSEVPKELWNALDLWEGVPADFWKTFQEELERTQDFLDLGDTRERTAVQEPGRAACLEETGAINSVLSVVLDRAGWKLTPVRSPEELARLSEKEVDVLVLHTMGAERLLDVARALRGAGSALPIVGVLPEGQMAPPRSQGLSVVVEPYDRIALLNQLPGT